MEYTSPTSIRYSTAFKMKVVKEIESGRLNRSQAMEKYGIRGSVTIKGWLKAFGKNNLIGKVVRVEVDKELSEIKRLKAENRKLESALAHSQVHVMSLESLIEIAKEDYGLDLKKKHGEEESMLPRKKQHKRG